MKFPPPIQATTWLWRASLVLVAAFAAGSLCAAPAAPAPAAGSTIIVLDASGSMRGRMGGETKMDIAKRSVRELVEALPENTSLGLVVYSHRKSGDCRDIELVIPPGPLDKAAFTKAVLAIQPRGLTPLTDAVEFAAEALDYTHAKASVILVSDGEETCGKQPCEAAARLEAAAKDLTIHAVAFDLGEKASRSFACLAQATGGRFLQANDAASLKDALTLAVAESTVAAAPAPEKLGEATLSAPDSVLAGAPISVGWTGPDNPADYVTIVPQAAADTASANFSYTRGKSPLSIAALIEPGAAELRYVTGRSHTVLARRPITITPAAVSLTAPEEAPAGSEISVAWTGPDNTGDFITVVPKSAAEGDYAGYADTRAGSPAKFAVPVEPGECEVRYVSGQGRKALARRPIKVTPADVTLDAPGEAKVGESVSVVWTGPNNRSDYITIVPKSLPDGRYTEYADTSRGSPASVRAPIEPGECEIRYMSGQGARVLGRRPIRVVAVEVVLEAPDEVVAGAAVTIAWRGPGYHGDYLTIVPKSLPDGRYAEYADASRGTPVVVHAPIDAGECEIRYMSGQGARVLGRRAIRVITPELGLDAPDEVVAGALVQITWKGPGNRGDYVTIVPKNFPDTRYGRYTETSVGSPLGVVAPIEPGECEIRYVSGQGARVLARRALRTTAPRITLTAPERVTAWTQVDVVWTGPNNPGDFLTLVNKETPDGSFSHYALTSGGSPAQLSVPLQAGPGEIRYMSPQGNRVLARVAIEIMPRPQ